MINQLLDEYYWSGMSEDLNQVFKGNSYANIPEKDGLIDILHMLKIAHQLITPKMKMFTRQELEDCIKNNFEENFNSVRSICLLKFIIFKNRQEKLNLVTQFEFSQMTEQIKYKIQSTRDLKDIIDIVKQISSVKSGRGNIIKETVSLTSLYESIS